MGVSKEQGAAKRGKGVYRRMAAADQIAVLRDLFPLILVDGDKKAMEERAKLLHIPFGDVKKAASWLLSEFPDIYKRSQEGVHGDLRLLLDENLPYALAPELQRYGYVSSVFMKGLSGKQDVYVYGYARIRDHFNAIVTKDRAQKPSRVGINRDLTNVALDRVKAFFKDKPLNEASLKAAKAFPQIIHLPSENPYRDGTVEAFQNHFEDIYQQIKSHTHHIIEVRPSGVFPRRDSDLPALWAAVNRVHKPVRDDKVIPGRAAKMLKYSRRVAGERGINISEIMGFVRADVAQEYKRLLKKRKDLSQDDVLELVHKTLQRVGDAYETKKTQDSLLVFEMVLKALSKSADEQILKKVKKPRAAKEHQSPLPS